MPKNITLELLVDVQLFELDEIWKAEALAARDAGKIYTWKTVGRRNWLEQGASIVDAAGLVVLPTPLATTIPMFDDELEED